MRGASARQGSCVFILALSLLLGVSSAQAFEFFDGRLQVHGFMEAQVRTIARDFDRNDGWDLTQWYTVLNLEVEADIAPDGFGPFDLISSFLRFDIRYDCVWTRGCGTMRSANTFGDRPRRLPDRLSDGRRSGLNGHLRNGQGPGADIANEERIPGDTRRYTGIPRQFLDDPVTGNFGRKASFVFNVPGITNFFSIAGPDGELETDDDPAQVAFGNLAGCRYAFQSLRGSNDRNATRTLVWNFRNDCKIEPNALNANQPNPFRGNFNFFGERFSLSEGNAGLVDVGGDINEVVFGDFTASRVGFGDLPLRPAPTAAFTDDFVRGDTARGIWVPSKATSDLIRSGRLNNPDQNFRQRNLEWNRGASQQSTKELREAYVDLELFDSRLWIRAGKQQIVWGKTELFRTTDQFNPQDLALASLPSLEESRIGLFAIRGVWSFYDLGPLEDVRLELAMNYDNFEPADLGRCGEPYTPLPVCNKTFGLQAHGLAAIGLAGEIKPKNPWDSLTGVEIGGRLEWRWDRFSFALTNFWGYNDFAYLDRINNYERNVDPFTGRPLVSGSRGGCNQITFTSGPAVQTDPDPAAPRRWRPGSVNDPDCLTPDNALVNHSINQTTFHLICASSIGFTNLDLTVCGQSVFNSQRDLVTGLPANNPITDLTIAPFLSNLLAGAPATAGFANILAGGQFFPALRQLNQDPCDGRLADCLTEADGAFDALGNPVPAVPLGTQPDINTGHLIFSGNGTFGLNNTLTQQQKALLGCGEFYGTNCEINGIDLMNAEASAILQSWPGTEGTGIDGVGVFADTGAVEVAGSPTSFTPSIVFSQPGTVGFLRSRGPVATRAISDTQTVILPGARGQNDPNRSGDDDSRYDPFLDGCTGPTPAGTASGCNAGDPVPVGSITDANLDGLRDTDANPLLHPFALDSDGNPQIFANEFAALSWNFLMLTVALSIPDDAANPTQTEFDQSQPYRSDGCSLRVPTLCGATSAFWAISGVQRNTVNAAGNGRFGRRDFVWAGGGESVLRYKKRNVLGLSVDVAEDVTKTNWSFEFTWIKDNRFADNDQFDGVSTADTYNLTVSVDRPTFINFLNANRTFFFNSQWFFQYISGHNKGFVAEGPWNTLATLTMFTGYFQDRLLPTNTFVYDFNSNSGAVLPSITYRFTENFSATFGLAAFFGRQTRVTTDRNPLSLPDRAGRNAYDSFAENGLSLVRERDEIFLRIRYAF